MKITTRENNFRSPKNANMDVNIINPLVFVDNFGKK